MMAIFLLHKDFNRQNKILKFLDIALIENGKYYQSDSKTFPLIDAIITPNKLFRITIATNHTIKVVGLNLLYEKLVKNQEIAFYFVIPEKLYANYQKQNFVTTNI